MDVFAAEESALEKSDEAKSERDKCEQKLDQSTKNRSEYCLRASGLEAFFGPLLEKIGGKWKALNDEIDAWSAQLKRAVLACQQAHENWMILKQRADAVRLVDLWKWRAFSRLYPSNMEKAEQMREWVDRQIRPYITSIVIAANGWVHYRLSFLTQDVSIHRKMRRVIDPCRSVVHPPKFRMRNPIWKNSNSLLGLALFILAPRLTSPGREFWCYCSSGCEYAWISKNEIQVLLAQPQDKPEPPHLNLLEHWMPCMPSVLCKLIGSY